MNPNITNMKIDSDTFVCMICFAAFIGYTLGLRNMVKNTVKIQQCHKVTQTNLSDLADILTSSHLMIDNYQKKFTTTMTTMQTQTQSPTHTFDNVSVCDSFMLTTTNVIDMHDDVVGLKAEEDKIDSIETSVSSEINNNNKMSPNNLVTSNNSEEEYEVILGNEKKNNTKNVTMKTKPQYYFGWFDSMF